jgi:hypothetical protein
MLAPTSLCQAAVLLLPILPVDTSGRCCCLIRVCCLCCCSLTCRTFDIALAEVCHLEDVSLLAYSPLAMGLLTVSRSWHIIDTNSVAQIGLPRALQNCKYTSYMLLRSKPPWQLQQQLLLQQHK